MDISVCVSIAFLVIIMLVLMISVYMYFCVSGCPDASHMYITFSISVSF